MILQMQKESYLFLRFHYLDYIPFYQGQGGESRFSPLPQMYFRNFTLWQSKRYKDDDYYGEKVE
jgi:hypothetical protein